MSILKDAVVSVNSKCSFSVCVQGNPVVSWFLNDKQLVTEQNIFISTSKDTHTLNIFNVTTKHQGTVKCLISNSAGSNECMCSLVVQDNIKSTIPVVLSFKEVLDVKENTNAEFVVHFSSGSQPRINWYYDHIHLTKEYGVDMEITDSKCKMILPEVTEDDAGVYECIITNSFGEVKCSTLLRVNNENISRSSTVHDESLLHGKEGPPEILHGFGDKEINEGDVATFQVRAIGNPSPNVQWFHDNKEIFQDDINYKFERIVDRYRMTIPISNVSDSGIYSCKLSNFIGECSYSGHIQVHESIYAPKFIEHSKDIEVIPGESCQLYAVIKGKPTPTVEWYKNNRSITEEKDYKFIQDGYSYFLQIAHCNMSHVGMYKCAAFNNAGESACVMNINLVTGENMPGFPQPLCDINAVTGDIVKLDVIITGSPLPVVQWFKSGHAIAESEKIKYEQDGNTFSLLIEGVAEDDSGVYKCLAQNNMGQSLCECNVAVSKGNSSPKFIKPLTDVVAPVHKKGVELSVIATGQPNPEVLFYKNGAVIESTPRLQVLHDQFIHTLLWKYIQPDDAGEYWAIATSSEGEDITHGNLTVQVSAMAPEFYECEQKYTVREGERLVLSAKANGIPTPVISWYKNDQLIINNDSYAIENNDGCSTLTILETKLHDNCFKCVATNSVLTIQSQVDVHVTQLKQIVGYSTSFKERSEKKVSSIAYSKSFKDPKVISIKSSKAPRFLQSFHDCHVKVGDQLYLEAVVSGDPFPEIVWYKQDKRLYNSSHMKIVSKSITGKCFLQIQNASKTDGGEYECVAKNKHGETSISCECFIEDPPVDKGNELLEIVGKIEKPVITNVCSDPHVTAGEEVKIYFNLTGNPLPKVEILKAEKIFSPPTRMKVCYTNGLYTLLIPKSTVQDEAFYKFIASNVAGEDSCTIELLVDDVSELEVVQKTIIAERNRWKSSDAKGEKNDNLSSSSSDDELARRPSIKPKKRRSSSKDTLSKESSKQKKESEFSSDDESEQPNLKTNQKSIDQDIEEVIKEEDNSARELANEVDNLHVEEPLSEVFEDLLNFENTEIPSFADMPKDCKAWAGKPLILLLGINECHPEPSITWFKDGNEISSSEEFLLESKDHICSLKIANSRIQHSGQYVCEIKNIHGSAKCSIKVDVASHLTKPEWITKLQDQVVTEGETIKLYVEVEGQPSPDIQFYQDNRILQTTDRVIITSNKETGYYSVQITDCNFKDGKTYKCIARNNQGTATCMGTVKVQETVIAPQFSIGLVDGTLVESKDIKLKVSSSGKPRPLIEWYYNEQCLKPSNSVKMRTERDLNILEIKNSKIENSGLYKAVSSNIAGTAETCCRIEIVEETKAPVFIYVPKNIRTVEGRPMVMHVSFSGKPEPYVEWLLNGEKISGNAEINNESGKSSLSIKSVGLSDCGTYLCKLSNKAGSVSCSIEFEVEEINLRPVFMQKLKDIVLVEKEKLCLSVEVKGKPKPSVSWFKNDKIIEGDLFSSENLLYYLTLPQCSLEDSGVYKVVAKNTAGESVCKAKVTVEEITSPPVFKTSLSDMTAVCKETAEFKVCVDGIPKPKLSWLKNNIPLEAKFNISMFTDGQIECLKITDISLVDAATYTCIANNKAGSASTDCKLEVKEALLAPVLKKKPTPEMELSVHDTFVVDFIIVGKPFPVVEVSKDDKSLPQGILKIYNPANGEGTLKIPDLLKSDEGIYKVTATNSEGSVSFSVCLQVNENVHFMKTLSDISVAKGSDAAFEVTFKGDVVEVDWYKDNEYIDESEKYEIIDEVERCMCIIHKCTQQDSGIYRCEILNEKNSQSCTAVLTVDLGSNATIERNEKIIEDNIVSESSNNVEESSFCKPTFSTSLKTSYQIVEGDDLDLLVSVTGNPTPEVSFYQNGVKIVDNQHIFTDIVGDSSYCLKVLNSTLNDEGEYAVKAENIAGETWSKGILLMQIRKIPPEFTISPENIQVTQGENACFKFNVSGIPKPTVNVYFKSKLIGEALFDGECFLFSLNNCSLEEMGEYKFEALNEVGHVQVSAKLIVEEILKPAVFCQKLKDISAVVGDSIKLEVSVDGSPPPRVSFYKDGIKISENSNTSISIEENIIIIKINQCNFDHAGVYTCKIHNKLREDACQATITVVPQPSPPHIKVVERFVILEGNKICAECEVNGYPPPLLECLKNGKQVYLNEACDGLVCFLDKPVAERTDAGEYSIKAQNQHGEAIVNFFIEIKRLEKPPHFLNEVKEIELTEGDDLFINFLISAYPEPNVSWYKNNKLIEITSLFSIQNNDNGYSLTYKNVNLSSAGMFTVLAENVAGKSESNCNVKVKEKPEAPHFVEVFSDKILNSGDSYTLVAKVTGKPLPSIIWHKNNTILKENIFENLLGLNVIESCLVFPDATVQNSGAYKCVLKNDSGEISHSANLTVEPPVFPPAFESVSNDVTVYEGQEFLLTSVCTGTTPLIGKWFKDGKSIQSNSSTKESKTNLGFSFKQINPQIADSGQYRLEVSNSAGTCSKLWTVLVKETLVAPTFALKLRDVSLIEGKDLDILVKVSGKPEPKLQWFINDKPLQQDSFITFYSQPDKKSGLRITSITRDFTGDLVCEAANDAGKVKSICQLNVLEYTEPPVFLLGIQDLTITEGETACLRCILSGKPMPTCTWFKSQSKLSETENIKMIQNGNEFSLIFSKIELTDNGKYKVTASNKKGEKSSTATIFVSKKIVPPAFIKLPESISVKENDQLLLCAEVIGTPKPYIVWKFNGVDLKDKQGFSIEEIFGQSTVKKANSDPEDSGVYSCIVFNEGGEVFAEAVVDVIANTSTPVFKKELQDIEIKVGEDIILSVTVHGIPTPNVKFYKDKCLLQNIDGIYISQDGEDWTVIIEEAEVDDKGTFECKAVNTAGEVSSFCFVKVIEIAEKPFIQPLDGLDNFSVKHGSNALFEVNFTGIPTPVIEWAKGEVLIDPSKKYDINEGNGYASLEIFNCSIDDEGTYACIALNESGEYEHLFKLNVEIPEEDLSAACINETSVSVSYVIENSVDLVFENQSHKKKIEKAPSKESAFKESASKDFSKQASKVDSKSVEKKSTPSVLNRLKQPGLMQNAVAPTFSKKPQNKDVKQGSSVKFTCNVSGTPDPNINWYFNKNLIKPNSNIAIKNIFGLLTLDIKKVTFEYSGDYKVTAFNDAGKCEADFVLSIDGKTGKDQENNAIKEIEIKDTEIKSSSKEVSAQSVELSVENKVNVIADNSEANSPLVYAAHEFNQNNSSVNAVKTFDAEENTGKSFQVLT